MQIKEIRKNKRFVFIYKLLETLFLALFGVYLFYRTAKTTTFGLTWPSGFEKKLLAVMAAAAVLRLLSTPLKRWKTLIALGMASIYCLVYRSDGYRFLLFYAVLTVGFIDIDYRKILKVFLLAAGAVYLATLLAGITGAITNYVYTSAGRGLRSAWGNSYPTDFAAKGLYLLMMAWIVGKRLPDWMMLFPCAAFVVLSRFIANSWNSTICGVAFFLAILYCAFERRVIERRPGLGWMKKGINQFETIAFPLFAVAMFALVLVYVRGTGVGYRLNSLLSDRLRLGAEAWREHGLCAFGTPFTMQGNGYTTFQSETYNFVDSSYMLILIRYGWAALLMLCLSWGWMAREGARCGDRRLVLVLGLIAMHSLMEHHFFDCHYNILLAMPLAAYAAVRRPQTDSARPASGTNTPRAEIIAHAATAALSVALLWVFAPAALSGIRTVLEYRGLCGGKETGWTLICICLGLAALGVGTVWAADNCLRAVLNRSATHGRAGRALALVLCIGIGIGVWLYTAHTVNAAAEENEALLEADREALEIAGQAATGKVYVGVLPSAYHRRIEGLDYSAFFEDDLARHYRKTVLLSADTERGAFIRTGCLYVQISDAHALYSDDQAVIDALMKAGYHATGYYSAAREVDLARAAKSNRLKYDGNTGLRLNKVKRPLKKGPYYNLYEGRYTVTYDLHLPEGAARDDSTVCTLTISAEKGQKAILQKEILGSSFDATGQLSVPITFSIWNSRNVSFGASVAKGGKVYVERISFVRTPNYDKHTFYNRELLPTREEYYGLEGEKTVSGGGYFACEIDYDGDDNVSACRYYDREGRLCLCGDGYAEIRREYNERHQVVREAYYDVDGSPKPLPAGNACMTCDYSDDGSIRDIRYFDGSGRPVAIVDGYAGLRQTLDAGGNIVCEEYFDTDGRPAIQPGGYCGYIQTFDDANNLRARRYIDPAGDAVRRTDGYSEVQWTYDGDGRMIGCAFVDAEGNLLNDKGINLAMDIPGEWSAWMTPVADQENQCFNFGTVLLGEKLAGDAYACQIEVEFSNVTETDGRPFRCLTQGEVDGSWSGGNIWNSSLIDLNEAPDDGVYRFIAIQTIPDSKTGACRFDLGMRCDYWASGSFRVRGVKVERGAIVSDASPGI